MTTDSDPRGAVIHKVIGFGGPNASLDPYGLAPKEFPSKQLLEDPFANVIGYGTTVRQPPYSMEQMVILAEAHPIHAACIEQKVADIVAAGPVFVPREEGSDSEANADEKKEMEEWWEALSEDLTSLEIVNAIWNDYETVGWGCMEIARDKVGEVRRIYHVPAHTVRAHVSGRLFIQIRQGRTVVFKAYGEEGDWYSTSVRRAPKGTDPDRLANELLVFRKPSRRSTWYGIPVYISAIGNITLAIAARDFNVLFFSNNREPRNLIILTGMAEDVDEVASSLTQQLAEQHKEPFHNLILPIEGDAKVQVERMMLQQNDMHFTKLLDQTDEAILTAHRIPPDRLGIARRGFLGGSVANVTNRIYKDGVVARGQDILEDRLGRFITNEFALHKKAKPESIKWKIDLEQLDVSDESIDISNTVALVKNELITLNEGRGRIGLPRKDEFEDFTLGEFMQSKGISPAAKSILDSTFDVALTQRTNTPVTPEQHAILNALDDLNGYIEEMLGDEDDGFSRNGHASALAT